MSTNQKITFVTGATGFIGRQLCQRLQEMGAYIRAAGRHPADGPWQEFAKWDLSTENIPTDILADVETVYHLAGRVHAVRDGPSKENAYFPVIVDGTRRLINACEIAKIRKFVYFSSVKAMGEGNPPGSELSPIRESWLNAPRSPYGLAKNAAEALVRKSRIEHSVILRPVMVFGTNEKGNLPRMIDAVKRGRFPPIPETGNKRSMVHVEDVIEWAVRAAETPSAAGKTYILSADIAVSTRELYDAIRESLGMAIQEWSIPMFLLKSAAGAGTLLGRILGKRVPLDLETLEKLTGSAWYSAELVKTELNHHPRHEIISWLTGKEK